MSAQQKPIARRRTWVLLACSLLALSFPAVARAGVVPANDDFADATPVTEPLPFADSTTTVGATLEANEPTVRCGFKERRTVWYSFTPSVDTIVSANTFGSDFDTILGVWEGSDLSSLSAIGCNDDSQDLQSSVVFLAEMGVEYRIQIGGFNGDAGNLEFHVRDAPAGVIEGTVTDEGTSTSLRGICVEAVDNLFGEGNGDFTSTAEDGTYRLVVRPSRYLVRFFDCRADDYVPEWWDNATQRADATEIGVVTQTVTSGIDAALTAGCPGYASTDRNQVIGTGAPETLSGTGEDDVVCGLGGDDTLTGIGGRDIMLGGRGADTVRGGSGSDRLFGGHGADALYGAGGQDHLEGNQGRDACYGGPGADRARSCEIEHGI
jgi:Ca2+-binding RTX toxin-like protein